MPVRRYTNEFYFKAPNGLTVYASTMDFRPALQPTGWVLSVKAAHWVMAEAGIAHSPEGARLHVHTAKNRYIRKVFFFGRYMRELSKPQRDQVEVYVSDANWQVSYYEALSNVKPNLDWRSANTTVQAEAVIARDRERLERIGID